MNRVSDTFKYHPKLSVRIFKVKVIRRSRSQRQTKTKFACLGDVITCFKSVFRQQREKMILKHFLNGPNLTKFNNRERT